ncbi:uncharacterized protein TNCV_3522881 [Trichonephila clavipes]|uniref:C2H2-type domain-containing protein n=1 Tax=Trichonephila clavipes TaxID=2585209 RepID=A0A8X7BGK2_TRICX|nr:uncharacterized protein TNCV_3522881 [Trichonephila clavipes]
MEFNRFVVWDLNLKQEVSKRLGYSDFLASSIIFKMIDERADQETTSPAKEEKMESPKNGAPNKPSKADELFFTDSDDDPFPEIECDLCSKQFSHVKMYEQHLNSKKHHQMLTKQQMMEKLKISEKHDTGELESESPEELQCDVCEKTFSSYIPYAAHIKGSVHAKNLKQKKLKESLKDKAEVLAENNAGNEEDDDLLQKPFARCTVCSKVFYDPAAYQLHMRGAAHKKKTQNQKICDSLKRDLPENPDFEDDELFSKCDVCNKSFSGPVPYKIHLKSAVHENQIKRNQAMEKLKDFFEEDPENGKMICKECKKSFTDPFAFKLHLDNNSHERQSAKEMVLKFVTDNPEIVAMKSIENMSSGEESDESGGYEKGFYFLVCKICHTSFSGLESAQDHVLSKKHLKTKKDRNEMKQLKKKLSEKKKDVETNGTNGHTEDKSAGTRKSPIVDEVDGIKKPKKERHTSEDFELV